MAIKDEITEKILKECRTPEDLIGKDGILKELTHHLGSEKYSPPGKKNGNSRNEKYRKLSRAILERSL